eukprot:1152935-Pelagomonas_calceolata.AAC.3
MNKKAISAHKSEHGSALLLGLMSSLSKPHIQLFGPHHWGAHCYKLLTSRVQMHGAHEEDQANAGENISKRRVE